jgi:hypothetical protein
MSTRACNYTLTEPAIEAGRKMAQRDNRSLSNFIDWLIRREAENRGLTLKSK